jgi:hypothetical protein
LPSAPEKTVAGILTYVPGKEIALELIGTFDSGKDVVSALIDGKSEDLIHGISSNSKKITLVNCYTSGESVNSSCPFPMIGYDCQFLIAGKHLDSFGQKCFRKAYVEIPVIKHWAPPSAIQWTYGTDGGMIKFRTSPEPINSVEIDENTQLFVQAEVNYRGDHYEPKIEQYTQLEIVKQTDSCIKDYYSEILLYEQFLSLATLQTVRCSKISLIDETLFQETPDGKKHYHPVEVRYIQREDHAAVDPSRHNFLFDHKAIAEQYPNVIQKWYADKDIIAPIRRHLIESISGKKVFSSVDFIIIIQAIEGFWWRFRDDNYKKNNKLPKKPDTKLKTIIEALLLEFDSVDKVRILNLDIDSVVDSRHYYSHFVNKSDKPHAKDGWDLYDLSLKLRKLLICCVLNFVGFENSQINQILNSSNNQVLYR